MDRYLPERVVRPGLAGFYRLVFSPPASTALSRRLLDIASRSQTLPAGTVVRDCALGRRPAERITVGATERPRTILYLHGGGYTVGSLATHRSGAAFLAREAGAAVYSLDYRLAPEHPYPAAPDDAVAAFVDLVEVRGIDPSRIVVSGDSAGGGLAVAAARRLIDAHGLRPAALVLFSPWTDLADDDAPMKRDVVINARWGERNAEFYAAGADRYTPGMSPLHGELSGLPPMWVQTGKQELLYAQILRFVAAARAAGCEVTLVEHPTLWHSGHTQAGVVRESLNVVREAGEFVRSQLDRAPAST